MPEWSDDRSRIDTIVTVDAGPYLRAGPANGTFRVPGGQIGRYRNVMVGAPEFQTGEEAVLFLTRAGPSIAARVRSEPGRVPREGRSRAAARLVVPPVLMAQRRRRRRP